jgi:surfeit locus 1 family protein
MMLRPRWVLALLLALAVAAGFALLGQWQLERAISSGEVVHRSTETVMPLEDVAQTDGPVRQAATGQKVRVSGTFVPGDDQIIADRFNGGTKGFWVVSRLVTSTDSASIAVARGWAADQASARAASRTLATDAQAVTVTGRFLPAEAPVVPAEGRDPHEMTTVSPAALVNLWANYTGQPVYAGYIVDAAPASGLAIIDSPVPVSDAAFNWLNLFYALEWAVFAGFAVFLWYRLVRDAWEREQEQAQVEAAPGT